MTRWEPTPNQVKPENLHRTFKQLLKMHYDLLDEHTKLTKAFAAAQTQIATLQNAPPPGGPINSKIVGLAVQPVDTNTLANGATLKFDKASGTFKIS